MSSKSIQNKNVLDVFISQVNRIIFQRDFNDLDPPSRVEMGVNRSFFIFNKMNYEKSTKYYVAVSAPVCL